MSQEEPARAETLRTLMAAFNKHDLDEIMSFFADDSDFHLTRGPEIWGRRVEGKDEIRAALEARFASAPDVSYTDDVHFVSGNRGVSEWTTSGTTSEGERFEARGCDLWTFDDAGKIRRKDSFWKIVEA